MEKKANSHKIVVLGEGKILYNSCMQVINLELIARVGKTSLTVRFCRNEFDES